MIIVEQLVLIEFDQVAKITMVSKTCSSQENTYETIKIQS